MCEETYAVRIESDLPFVLLVVEVPITTREDSLGNVDGPCSDQQSDDQCGVCIFLISHAMQSNVWPMSCRPCLAKALHLQSL